MRGAKPADTARRLVNEAEFEIDSIRELLARCRSLDRTGAPKPPPLPLMRPSPPASNQAPAQARETHEAANTLTDRLALVEPS
jgi:hypothetical protein